MRVVIEGSKGKKTKENSLLDAIINPNHLLNGWKDK